MASPQILDGLATVVLQQGGEQADRFARTGLGENPCGECQFDIDAGNFIHLPNHVRRLKEGSLIVEEMGKLLAGLPVVRILQQGFTKLLLVGLVWRGAHNWVGLKDLNVGKFAQLLDFGNS